MTTRVTRRVPRWAVAALACACGAPAGCAARRLEAEGPPKPVVTVVAARRATVPIRAEPIGTTRALQSVSIRARVKGFLREQHFEEGSVVKKGQLLFVIEEDTYRATLDSARGKLAEAEAALARARQSKAPQVAKAQLDLDRSQLALARIEEARVRALVNRRASSPEELDKAKADLQKYQAQVEADTAALEQATADYDVNIQAAQASVASAKASVREAEINLGYCRMDAPIDGRIGEAKVKLGNLVGTAESGQQYTELATIQQLDPMGVDIQVPSRYLDRATRLIRDGLPLTIYRPGIEGDRAYPNSGECYFIDNAIDSTTSTFLVKARVANPESTLLPGEYVKADMTIDRIRDAVVVPEAAVVETQAGPTVEVVDAQGKVAVVPVKAGPAVALDGEETSVRVIESGLEPGAQVIVEGLQLVRPGMAVQVERQGEGAQ